MKKRILALLLIVAVAASVLVFAVGAEGGHENHCGCLYAATGVDTDKCASHNDNQSWTELDPASLPTSGYYYLTADLVLTKQWSISGDLHLCTNGYDISRSATAAENLFGLIRVGDGKSLSITNCKAQIKDGRLDTSDPAKTSTLSGAKSSNTAGALIHLNTNASLKLYGVEIANNTSSGNNTSGWGAGAVLACNTGINMDIAYTAFRNNSATVTSGGAITIRGGTTNIRNTVFTGNTAEKHGAAIYMCNAASNVTITDCDFSANEAKNGEGGAVLYLGKGTATLTNVTMTGNVNKGLHGSVITQNGGTSLRLNNCTITGNRNTSEDKRAAIVAISDITELSVSGNTVIAGNLNNGKESNILLREYNSKQPKLTVGALTQGSDISVRTVTDKAAADFLKAGTNCPVQTAENVYIVYENNLLSTNAATQQKHGVHFNGTAFSFGEVADHNHADCPCTIANVTCKDHGAQAATSVAWKKWMSRTSLPTTSGYYYLTGDVTLSSQQVISADVHICTNGYDITSTMAAAATHGVIRVWNNGNLTIGNCKAKVADGRLDVSDPAKTSTISGGKTTTTSGGMMRVDEGRDLTLYGVQIANNECTGSNDTGWCAGAIMAQGNKSGDVQNVTIAYAEFSDNRSTHSSGGALSLRGGVANIRNTVFTNNFAATNGGAIAMMNTATTLTMADCDFAKNGYTTSATTANGGAIYVEKGTLDATNVTFTDNRVTAAGGAVYSASAVKLSGNTFKENQAANGGAVYIAAGSLTSANSTFTGNKASSNGGAVALHNNDATPTATITGGSMKENTSGTNASALYVSHSNVTVQNTVMEANISGQSGAVYVRGGGAISCTNVTVSGNENTGPNGSAFTAEGGSKITLDGCTVAGNKNTYDSLHAGIVMVDNAVLTVSGETVIDGNMNGGAERNVFLRTVNVAPKMTIGQLTGEANISVATSALEGDPDNFLTKGVTGAWNPVWNDNWVSYDNNGMQVSYSDDKQFFFKSAGQHDNHCLCAGDSNKCNHTVVEWTPWGKSDSLPTSGNYYLTKDVVLTKGVDINNIQLNLCLNGHTIKQTAASYVLNIVGENGALAISDCTAKTAGNTYVAGTITGGKNGAVLVRNNTFKLYDGIISGNTRSSTGGAVVMLGDGKFYMYNGQISGNESTGSSAGAVSVEKNSEMYLYDGIIRDNKSFQGGAIALNEGKLYMYGGMIRNNAVSKHGGAIHLFKSTAQISGGTVFKNTAVGGGGAIQVSKDSVLTISGGKFEGNTTAGNGGAIQLSENSKMKMTGGEICWNEATLGAGAYLHSSQITVSGGSIRNNTTVGKNEKNETIYGSGGGVLAVAGSKVTVTDGRIQDNLAWHGSGIYVINSELNVSGGLIQNNGFTKNEKGKTVYIARMGGGIYANGSKVSFTGGEIRGNRAENGGGIYVRQGSTFAMTGGEIANNAAVTGNGGGLVVASSSKATFQKGTIRNNTALILGGGIFVDGDKQKDQGSTLIMNGGVVQNNKAEKGGGILLINYSHMDFTGGTIQNNTTTNNGGGLFVANFCTMKMTGGTVKGNKAVSGAGVQCYKAKADIYGGTITGNTALQNGGGIFSQTESTINLRGGTVSKNTAKSMGGGMFANVESTLGIYGGKITNNTAEKGAGVLIIDKCKLIVKGGVVEKNTATNNGGGIFVANTSEMKMTGGKVIGNKAVSGAGLAAYLAKADLTGGLIEKNEATQHGAGFLVQRESVINMKDVTIRKNNAPQSGGGIHISGFATLNLENTVIEANTAGVAGGGIFASGDKTVVTLKDSFIRTNTAGTSGGGISSMSHARVVMESGKVNNNKAAESGGGIYVRKGYVDLLAGEIFQNTAGTTGGGLSVEGIDIIMRRNVLTATEKVKIYENTAEKGGGVFLGSGQGNLQGTLISNNLANLGGGFYAGSMGRSILDSVVLRGNTAKTDGGGLYFQRGTKSYLTDCQIMNNLAAGEGGGVWVDDDLQLDSCKITGNKAKGAGGVYIAPASYDGASYVSSVIKIGGEMFIAENEGNCTGMYIGEGTYVNLAAAGLTGDTKIDVALATGNLTNTVFGAYDYEGGDLKYVITCGDRSVTDPEPMPVTVVEEPEDATALVWYIVAGAAAVVVIVGVLILLLALKKKKAKQ